MKTTQLFLAATLALGGIAMIGCDDTSNSSAPTGATPNNSTADQAARPSAVDSSTAKMNETANQASDRMHTAGDQATQGAREAGAKTGDAITDGINKIDNSVGKGANAPGHGGSPDTNSGAVQPGDGNPLNNRSDNSPTTKPVSPAAAPQ